MCGLCGNFDQRSNNDFTTRDHMVVDSELDFGNSWKEASACPDVSTIPVPCSLNPHRRSWAEKQCSLIKSKVFRACHGKVGVAPGRWAWRRGGGLEWAWPQMGRLSSSFTPSSVSFGHVARGPAVPLRPPAGSAASVPSREGGRTHPLGPASPQLQAVGGRIAQLPLAASSGALDLRGAGAE